MTSTPLSATESKARVDAFPRTALPNVVRCRRLGIETHHEAIAFMHRDCWVSRSEGFTSHARIQITRGRRAIIATLYQVTSDLVAPGEVGLSESGWKRLGLDEGDEVLVSHPPVLQSFGAVRGKIHGRRLDGAAAEAVIRDTLAGRYSDIHISALIAACAARPLARDEIVALTRAMVDVGDRIDWGTRPIVDKHCVGGLPGNRTTPIVVAIVAAAGLTIPKTSSRAITSPAGTADAMETMAPVELDAAAMRKVVEREGGCVVWGGKVRLSPVDDLLISVERALDVDNGGQLIASVLSKKIAAGATHLVLDLPVGATAKVRSGEEALALKQSLVEVAAVFGIEAKVLVSDGTQPVGRRIGPALEAHDVLGVLQRERNAPLDLRERALALAGEILELAERVAPGRGYEAAQGLLDSGRAWEKFQRICDAQGGMRQPPTASYREPLIAGVAGEVVAIDNRRLAKVAKLAGAPAAKSAGVELLVRVGDAVAKQAPLLFVHAETAGELTYAQEYLAANRDILVIR